jgi:hypothetical protein
MEIDLVNKENGERIKLISIVSLLPGQTISYSLENRYPGRLDRAAKHTAHLSMPEFHSAPQTRLFQVTEPVPNWPPGEPWLGRPVLVDRPVTFARF